MRARWPSGCSASSFRFGGYRARSSENRVPFRNDGKLRRRLPKSAPALAAFSRASLARISDSVCCTWPSNTYCAGRCLVERISGAISPSVLMPRRPIIIACERMLHHRVGGGRLVAAMGHAVGAFFVAAGAVGVPVGVFHQFVEGLGVAFAEQIARLLPAEDVARRHAPRRAVEFLVAGEEVEEHRRSASGSNSCPCRARTRCGTVPWSCAG